MGRAPSVFAVDLDPRILKVLRARVEKSGAHNVTEDRPSTSAGVCPMMGTTSTASPLASRALRALPGKCKTGDRARLLTPASGRRELLDSLR